ncbi:hypothetical protein [Rhizobium indigoferae]|uniref:Uncharacterized protein n=1 Tax=Rhizobium indigoferae TaxID=158891 RepID=A0ABZ1DUK8_9HYPH|nr:hypothetical protein [Rhizobium indigoferae]WRW39896.1 hypothetical protein U5G49_005253 [Rhizobium indigoferae]
MTSWRVPPIRPDRLIDSQIGLTLDLIKLAYRSRAKTCSDRKKAIQFIADQNVG